MLVTDADTALCSRDEKEMEREKEMKSVGEQERNRLIVKEIVLAEDPSSIAQSIRSAFKAGPWRVNFSAFLLAACEPPEQESTVTTDAAVMLEGDVMADRSMVLSAVRAAAMQESDVHVIIQLLQTALTFRVSPTPSHSTAVEPAADILCSVFTSRRLTADHLLQYMVQSNRLGVLSDMLMSVLNQINTLTQTPTPVVDIAATEEAVVVVAEPVAVTGEVVLTKSIDGHDVALSKNTETLRLLVFIAGVIVRCDGAHSNHGVGAKMEMEVETTISAGSSSKSLLMCCASTILSCCTVKDCRKHFLPLLADALCNTPFPSPRRNPLTLLPYSSTTPAYHAMLGNLSPLGLLDLLAIAGVTGAAAAGGVTTLTSSGLTVDCLQFIVDTIDEGVRSTLCGDMSTAESWQVLVKPFSAKRIERIQCELQPLILWVIATTVAGARGVSDSEIVRPECVEEEKEKVGKAKEKMEVEMSVIAVENLRSWALQSITLSNLFTLKELHTNIEIDTAGDLHVGGDGDVMVCTSSPDEIFTSVEEDKTEAKVEVEVKMEVKEDVLDSSSPVPLPHDRAVSESVSSRSSTDAILSMIAQKDTFSALQLCLEFLRIVPSNLGSNDDIIQTDTTTPSTLPTVPLVPLPTHAMEEVPSEMSILPVPPPPTSPAPPPTHDMEVEQSEDSSSTEVQRVLSWCRELLHGAVELSSNHAHAAALVISTALLSCDKENVLFSLSLCSDADSLCTAQSNREKQSEGNGNEHSQWHISAIMLSSLLTECWELSLSRFKRGIDIMESLPPLQTDGSAMYVLVRQLLMLVADGIFDCTRGLAVANLHTTHEQDVPQSESPKALALKQFTAAVLSAVSDFTAMLVHHTGDMSSVIEGSHFRNTIRLTGCTNRMSSRASTSLNSSSQRQQVGASDKEELRRECESVLRKILHSDERLFQSWSHISFHPKSRKPIQ